VLSFKLFVINNDPFFPTRFRSKDCEMTGQDFVDIRAHVPLLLGPDGLYKRRNESRVSTTMAATIIDGYMSLGRSSPKICDRKLGHISYNFPMAKVHPELTIADEVAKGDHGERCRPSVRKLNVDDLIIANVILAFVHADPIRTSFESCGDVFNIR